METLFKPISGVVAALAALFAPAVPLALCASLFIVIDFISGVAADRKQSLDMGLEWYFESHKAWRSLLKIGFVIISIGMAHLMECCVLDFTQLYLTKLFTGFVCGVEFWSFLENAAQLSEAPLFLKLRHFFRRKLRKEVYDE